MDFNKLQGEYNFSLPIIAKIVAIVKYEYAEKPEEEVVERVAALLSHILITTNYGLEGDSHDANNVLEDDALTLIEAILAD